jgi:serine/threonine protein kinase
LAETFLCQIAIFKGAGIQRDAFGKPDQYPSEEYRDKYIKYRDDTIEPWLRDYLLSQPQDHTNIPVSRHFYDLVMNKCLAVDPAKRATCQELLNHPYFTVSSSAGFGIFSNSSPKTPPVDLLFTTLSSPERKQHLLQTQQQRRSPLGIKQTGI